MAAVETDLYVALLAIGVEGEEAQKLADNARRASDNVFYPILLVMLNRLADMHRWQTEFDEGMKRFQAKPSNNNNRTRPLSTSSRLHCAPNSRRSQARLI